MVLVVTGIVEDMSQRCILGYMLILDVERVILCNQSLQSDLMLLYLSLIGRTRDFGRNSLAGS